MLTCRGRTRRKEKRKRSRKLQQLFQEHVAYHVFFLYAYQRQGGRRKRERKPKGHTCGSFLEEDEVAEAGE